MKKFKVVVSIMLIVLILCGGGFLVYFFSKDSEKKKIVTTSFPIYDICREILGTEDDLMLLMDNGVDLHNYSPTASDIANISEAELFIYIGGESDDWVGDVLGSINNVNLRTLSLMDIEGLTLLEETSNNIIESEEESESEEHEHDYDEHIWLSIKNVITMTNEISNYLIKVYPELQQLILENTSKYIAKLQTLDDEYESNLTGSEKTIIVADRFPFVYMMNDYNIKYYAVFSGCSTETQASVESIATLVEKINECDVDYLLVLENSDQTVARSCMSSSSCKAGLQVLIINSCQSITRNALQNNSYLQIMTANLEVLKKALN
ncbi:MAG: metal ABC transporter substrate-binding protein [Christensenellales bacterium]